MTLAFTADEPATQALSLRQIAGVIKTQQTLQTQRFRERQDL